MPQLYSILKYPDKRLRLPTTPVTINNEIKDIVSNLTLTMYKNDGLGIAAIQVGLPLQIFIISDNQNNIVVFINPEPPILSGEKIIQKEGCLSFPGIFVNVERSESCSISALDLEGKHFIWEGSGIEARAVQHEYDHLSGKLLIDFVSNIKKQSIHKKSRKW